MIALAIILVILVLLVIVALLRVGVLVEYDDEGLVIRLKLSSVLLQLYPPKGKKKKKEKEIQNAERPLAEKFGGTFEMLRKLLPVIIDAAGGLKEEISVDVFEMDIIWRAPDPFKCAIGFGAANVAVGMIWPMIEQNFHVKERQIRTSLDFRPGKPSIGYLMTQMTMRVWQLTVWSARLAVRLWKIYKDTKEMEKYLDE